MEDKPTVPKWHWTRQQNREEIGESIASQLRGKPSWNKGIKCSEETKKKISERMKDRTPWNKGKKRLQVAWNKGKSATWAIGEKNVNWRGGVERQKELRKIRCSAEYTIWRCKVLVRDNFTCILCKTYPSVIADHIKSFSNFPELRFDVDNGRTVCKKCHIKLPTNAVLHLSREDEEKIWQT